MRVGSLFSGIGGFDEGFVRAGMNLSWQCEADPQCLSVLRYHYPQTLTHEDVSNVTAPIEPVELLCGGFPCQDLSVAGRRAGLAGERSGLFHEFMRIASECSPPPRWIVIENVPGLLSSNGGRDMATVLGALEELGYGWAYRCLDSQFFGVPQRRRRIFIVGHLGDWRPAAKVLFERESVRGNTSTRRKAGEGVAPTISSRSKGGGGLGTDTECDGGLIPQTYDMRRNGNGRVVNSLTGDHLNRPTDYTPCVAHPIDTRNALRTTDKSGVNRQGVGVGEDGEPSPTLTDVFQPAVAIQNATRGKDQNGLGVSDPNDPMFTLDQGSQHAVAFQQNTRDEVRYIGQKGKIVGALASEPGMKQQNYLQQNMQVRRLTPRECERLQGFPDDWTQWGRTKDGEIKEIADGPRYKMLGNAVTVQVAEWIGRRIMEAEQC